MVITLGIGVFVASTILTGIAVDVPVLAASTVACAARVAAAKTFSAVGVAVTTQGVKVAVGKGVGVGGLVGVVVGNCVAVSVFVAVNMTVWVSGLLTVVVSNAVACACARAGVAKVAVSGR